MLFGNAHDYLTLNTSHGCKHKRSFGPYLLDDLYPWARPHRHGSLRFSHTWRDALSPPSGILRTSHWGWSMTRWSRFFVTFGLAITAMPTLHYSLQPVDRPGFGGPLPLRHDFCHVGSHRFGMGDHSLKMFQRLGVLAPEIDCHWLVVLNILPTRVLDCLED